jgi:transposase
VRLVYAPIRLRCPRCDTHAVECLAWADKYQRQTHRFQQQLAFDASSMPLSHVAARYGVSWHTVARSEADALLRWNLTRSPSTLVEMGVDEKYLGRRHKRGEKYVTIVSNLQTGEPIWYGLGRSQATLRAFFATLTPAQKKKLEVAAMDMFAAFAQVIRADPDLAHVRIVHDPFHLVKRAGEAVTEVRRQAFFRASKERRAMGRGAHWLVLRAWEKTSDKQKERLRKLLGVNATLARAYQVKEEFRLALKAEAAEEVLAGVRHVLRRTQRRTNVPLRRWHDSIVAHWEGICAWAERRPAVGGVEALNNNWETLVRQGRGYRDLEHLFHKLRFATVNPLGQAGGVERFLALGLTPPGGRRAA